MSDDVQWWTSPELPQGGTTRGKDALIENWSNIPNYWVEFAVTPSEFVDGGDKVIVIGTQTGKAKDSGNSFESPFVHILWSSGGQVSRSEFHSDSAAGLKALG